MSGWITIAVLAAGQAAASIWLLRRSVGRWWDAVAVAVLTLVLIRPMLAITGDVSRYLPPGAFAEGADGKDQIIIASVVSTVLLPLLLASAALAIARIGIGLWSRRRP